MPMATPPWTWAAASWGLMIFPLSWTAQTLFTLTLPMGTSTSRSTKLTP